MALGAPAFAMQPARKTFKISLKYGMIQSGETIAEKFAMARDAGFDGVEMDSPNPFNVDEVLAAKESAGIEIPGVVDSVHWGKPLSHPDPDVRLAGRSALQAALKDCSYYGGTTVLLVPGVVNAGVSYADAYERSQAEIKPVLDMAKELRVSIAFENVWNHFLLSPLEAARYVDEVGGGPLAGTRPNRYTYQPPPGYTGRVAPLRRVVGWYFDVGNIVNYGWPEHWIETLGDRILKLDVKEFSRGKRDREGLWKGFGVEIGEGDVDWALVREKLAVIPDLEWASAEVGGGDMARLKDIAARMQRVLNDA